MIDAKVTVIDETAKLKTSADRSIYKNLGHAAASIRKEAIASIERSPDPSEPGTPPHTRGKRKGFKRGILYAMDGPYNAVIGTAYSKLGPSGEAHEHGGVRGETELPARPFMGPALEQNLDRFYSGWAGSIGS